MDTVLSIFLLHRQYDTQFLYRGVLESAALTSAESSCSTISSILSQFISLWKINRGLVRFSLGHPILT